jgi:gas vesicle protein
LRTTTENWCAADNLALEYCDHWGGKMNDKYKNNVGWFLAGLSVGAVAAILYAPKSGREVRKAIVTGVDDGRKHLASLGRDARKQVSDLIASGKKIVVGAKREANAATDAGREAIHAAAGDKHS